MVIRSGYTESDWYWVVQDTNPTTQVYSTASNAYVANNAAAFLAWLADGIAAGVSAYGNPLVPITAAADDGSGNTRLTVPTTSYFATGQRWYFGTTNGVQQITVIDGTHIDLDGLLFVNYVATDFVLGATVVATEAELFSIVGNVAFKKYTIAVADVNVTASSKTLDNPLQPFVSVSTSSAGRTLTLPAMNEIDSIPKGQVFIVRNEDASTNSVDLLYNGGTTLQQLVPGRQYVFILANNDTADGDIRVIWRFHAVAQRDIGGGLTDTGSSVVRSALTGDVTAAQANNATTITNDAVTNAKLANMAEAAVKGRVSSGTGDPEDIAAGQLPATATNDAAAAGRVGEYKSVGSAAGGSATVTISNASPAVVTWTGHGLDTGAVVHFTTTGTLPTGLSPGTNYYINRIDANTFNVATTLANLFAGTYVNTSSAGSGVHTGNGRAILTTGSFIDIHGIQLEAGDWDLSSSYQFSAEATTVVTGMFCSHTTSSGGVGSLTDNQLAGIVTPLAGTTGPQNAFQQIGPSRFSVNATTTIFLTARATFTTAALFARGALRARRIR